MSTLAFCLCYFYLFAEHLRLILTSTFFFAFDHVFWPRVALFLLVKQCLRLNFGLIVLNADESARWEGMLAPAQIN